MDYNEQAYIQYIDKLRQHLFRDKSIEEIFNCVENNHRKRRFAAMYVLRDQETFEIYYAKRFDLGLEEVFDEIISALFFEIDKLLIKRKLISRLKVNKEMISKPVSELTVKMLTKDLQSFVWYATKQILSSPVL